MSRTVRALSVCTLVSAWGCGGNLNDESVPLATTARVSVAATGAESKSFSIFGASASTDARFVAFATTSYDLHPEDTDADVDVLVKDVQTGSLYLASRADGVAGAKAAPGSESGSPAISGDGQYVAFASTATNLVGGITGGTHVYRRNTWTHQTVLVDVNLSGGQAMAGGSPATSGSAAVSSDGRYVLFSSDATNLTAGVASGTHVYRRDMTFGQTVLVDVESGGTVANASSSGADQSPDGRYVAFASSATNLPSAGNSTGDIFLRDMSAGTPSVTLISLHASGADRDGSSSSPSVSSDGRFVAFLSDATNLAARDLNGYTDVFVRDRIAGTTQLISVHTSGSQAGVASTAAAISPDGRFVAFVSQATNLVDDDTNALSDVFLRDLHLNVTYRGSVGTHGTQGLVPTGTVLSSPTGDKLGADSSYPRFSGDSRYLVFMTDFVNLVVNDKNGANDVFLRGPLQ